MKSLIIYINEALIDKKSKVDTNYTVLDKYKNHKFVPNDDLIFKEIVDYLSSISDNYTVKFNRKENNDGDFHLFIYKNEKLMVVYDGYWEPQFSHWHSKYIDLSIYHCAKQAEEWIKNN